MVRGFTNVDCKMIGVFLKKLAKTDMVADLNAHSNIISYIPKIKMSEEDDKNLLRTVHLYLEMPEWVFRYKDWEPEIDCQLIELQIEGLVQEGADVQFEMLCNKVRWCNEEHYNSNRLKVWFGKHLPLVQKCIRIKQLDEWDFFDMGDGEIVKAMNYLNKEYLAIVVKYMYFEIDDEILSAIKRDLGKVEDTE